MDANLRDHFDRAVGDDPGDDPGTMAHVAIAARRRTRRRQRAVALVGVVAALGTAAVLSTGGEEPPTLTQAMMLVAAPSCSEEPVERDATDVALFLDDAVTGPQRSALAAALAGDDRVGAHSFETREQAYQRFRVLWADSPDFVAAVDVDQIPESFRLRLTDPGRYAALRDDYAAMAGVGQIVGRVCPVSAPVGGIL